MRCWQLSALALGAPAKRKNPPSAAVASAAWPNSALLDSFLPNSDDCKCSRKGIERPPEGAALCWLGFVRPASETPSQKKCRANSEARKRRSQEATKHRIKKGRSASNTRALRAIHAAHDPLVCFRGRDARWLHEDDDRPWRCVSGKRRHRRASAVRQ